MSVYLCVCAASHQHWRAFAYIACDFLYIIQCADSRRLIRPFRSDRAGCVVFETQRGVYPDLCVIQKYSNRRASKPFHLTYSIYRARSSVLNLRRKSYFNFIRPITTSQVLVNETDLIYKVPHKFIFTSRGSFIRPLNLCIISIHSLVR